MMTVTVFAFALGILAAIVSLYLVDEHSIAGPFKLVITLFCLSVLILLWLTGNRVFYGIPYP